MGEALKQRMLEQGQTFRSVSECRPTA
jgi:hypothetical protein